MSTMRADTLANSAGTGSPAIVGGELCRARFNLNGTGTIAARDTFNVSSFVDNGTGNYSVTYAIAMPNAWYSLTGSATYPGTGTGAFLACVTATAEHATAYSRFGSINAAGTSADMELIEAVNVGDRP